MARYNLLEMTQSILSSMNADEVNSIADTVESSQVVECIRTAFYDMMTEVNLPEKEALFELVASGDSAKPCIMTLPTDVSEMNWLRYNKQDTGDTYEDWQRVKFMPFSQFLDMQNNLREETSDVGTQTIVLNGEDHQFLYKDNKQPDWYTTVDDRTLIFDSYDADIDTTLQANKTMAHGTVQPTFTESDGFDFDLDETQYSYLYHKAKIRAHFEILQTEHGESVDQLRRSRNAISRKKRRTPNIPAIDRLPNYSR